MIRNLKVMGLALVVVFALGAVVASAASAAEQGTLTAESPVKLDLTETGAKGSGSNAFTTFGAKTECFGSTYVGRKINSTEPISVPATTATVTPTYNQGECRAFAPETEATIQTNGCDFVFHIGNTSPAGNTEGKYALTADVVCPAGQKLHLTEYLNADHKTSFCTTMIGPQMGLKGAIVTSTPKATPEDLDITGTFTGITAERTGTCLLDGHGNKTMAAEWDIDTTVTGTNEGGIVKGITVTD